ncbi:MAG: LysR family transcriptional regulator, partial [Jaaginema sp. PMC 1079.18]|nr:LysR family transcriptional regulator [Jaaginema sp. PMC 1079.18]
MEISDLNALVVFAHVVKQGSFVGAARRLNLPKATVSRRIQKLEDSLQVKLLERSTRVVRPTEIGKLYFEYCDRIVAEIEEANAAIDEQQAEPQGILRTSAPSAFTHLFLKDLIPEFLSRYPKIQ